MANLPGGNNPAGANQVGPGKVWGQAQKMKELTREAPMSGAPLSGRALNTPERAQDAARRPVPPGGTSRASNAAGAGSAPAPAYVPPDMQVAATWAAIASIPGSSALVQQIAAQARGTT